MAATTARTPIQMAAMLFGVTFLVVGVAGFIPGLTQDYERIDVYDAPGAELLGIFAVNWLHNIAHLAFGVAGLAMASTAMRARTFLLVGGTLYLALWIYGLIIEQQSAANFIALNTADNWLHLFLGVGMIATGFILGREIVATRSRDVRRAA